MPPDLTELIDVIAVGRTVDAGDVVLTLLSIERYREGFLALFRLETDRSTVGSGWAHRDFCTPALVVEAIDSVGGTYTSWPQGGSGGGGRQRLEFRWTLRFHPEVRGEARWLRLTVTRIDWEAFDNGTRRVDRTTTGPWTFEIALP